MLKRLRVKFIALNMIIVAAVLILTFSAVCILDYQQSISEVTDKLDATLARITPLDDAHRQKKHQEGGWLDVFAPSPNPAEEHSTLEGPNPFNTTIPNGSEHLEDPNQPDNINPLAPSEYENGAPVTEDESPESFDDQTSDNHEPALPPRIGGFEDEKTIPIATYTLRDGTLVEITKHSTASIDADLLTQAAEAVTEVPDGHGELQTLGLFYAKRTLGNECFVAFADASAADSWQSVAWILGGVGVAALVVFFVISLFFSKWALAPVAKAWEKQRQFIANASHDLKTPLTVILANSSILQDHPEKTVKDQMQWIESTEHEALSMQTLVNDLLTLARIDETEANPQLTGPSATAEPIDFSDLVEGELLQMESLAFEHGIELTSEVNPELFVTGNTASLRRIVTTLVDNACKYAGVGHAVSVNLAAVNRKAVLRVHNTGSAIDPDDLPHIFDRFYRADKARNRNDIGGHGLGLAIAQALAQEAGGSITAESSASEGTTFTLTLPLSNS